MDAPDRAAWGESGGPAAGAALDEAAVRRVILETVDRVCARTLKLDSDFFAHGLDSLDQVQILMRIEEVHGLKVPDEAVDECRSIAAIVDFARRVGAAG